MLSVHIHVPSLAVLIMQGSSTTAAAKACQPASGISPTSAQHLWLVALLWMGHTACCATFTATYLGLSLRQSDMSAATRKWLYSSISAACTCTKAEVSSTKYRVIKSFHGDGSSLACLISCQSVEFRSVLAIHAVQKFNVIFCESHIAYIYAENNRLLRKLELSFLLTTCRDQIKRWCRRLVEC